MCFKFREELTNPPIPVNLINDDYRIVLEFILLAYNIIMEICVILESFFLF
jgi:hypothetical protein